jgi:hypothetical protein
MVGEDFPEAESLSGLGFCLGAVCSRNFYFKHFYFSVFLLFSVIISPPDSKFHAVSQCAFLHRPTANFCAVKQQDYCTARQLNFTPSANADFCAART